MDYYNDKLIPFVDDLINCHPDFSDIDIHSKKLFAYHLLEIDDREPHIISQNDHYDDIVACLCQLLIKDDTDQKLYFADTVMTHVIDYYKKRMQEIWEERTSVILRNQMEDAGLTAAHHRDNGEVYYRRA